ncbi:hypothetical protein ACEQ8H_007238 [Pleosporales sp. CAS-2024a]
MNETSNQQVHAKISPKQQKLSDTSASSPVLVSTPSMASEPDDLASRDGSRMESSRDEADNQAVEEAQPRGEQEQTAPPPPLNDAKPDLAPEPKTTRSEKKSKPAAKKSKQVIIASSSSDSSDEDSDSESESDSEDDKTKRKRKQKLAAKRAASKKKQKAKSKTKKSKSRKHKSTSDDTASSDSESESDRQVRRSDKKKGRKALKVKGKKSKKADTSSDDSNDASSLSSSSSTESESEDDHSRRKLAKAKRKSKKSKVVESSSSEEVSDGEETSVPPPAIPLEVPIPANDINTQVARVENLLVSLKAKQAASSDAILTKLDEPVKKNALEFKRVDQVYDMKIRDWKLVESNKDNKDEFDCVFTVRRRLTWEGKYQETQVDIKSKVLRNCLQEIFKECKSISLVEDTPQLDPHTLFHYYNEIKAHVKKELKPKLKRAKRSKDKKLRTQQIAQCKLLLKYIDEDYTSVRKALKPMLKAGTITYDLVWALFKPNTIAFTPTYANKDDPRCFRVDFSYEYESWLTQAKSLVIDGRYLEYDGKSFGLGDHQVQIEAFKGHKKITSLSAYPLKYHKDPEGIRRQLIERGKKFVALQGMNYRLQKGIAYMKHKGSVVRFNINGRVMIDPAIFRRINPNYQLSYLKQDELNQDEEQAENDSSDDCCCEGDDGYGSDMEKDKLRVVMWKDNTGQKWPITVSQSVIDQEMSKNPEAKVDRIGDDDGENKCHIFTEEELLIASPVVLGFAFSEKYWLEFSLSGIEDIKWNDEAFGSLVLPDRIKQNLKGLVSSHRFHAAKTIDDVIQGKGKGLNVVLHGPPGVGKTLTGESIAEYLKCPLYAVSAGELGTNSRSLEQDLNRIMDITHSWGAILLLDEADVFLEARQPHDIHRNSLVSVFLRLTEYYQGILFLTTNRVETFDEAFQSRIHMGIRYENLQPKARKKIWQHHVGKVEAMAEKKSDDEGATSGGKTRTFSEGDFDELSKRNMNGRQIKNTVKTSQSIALAEKSPFSMDHVKRVLEVAEAFEDDMRGGKGYRDAMRHYT